MESIEVSKKKVEIWSSCIWFPKGQKTHFGKFTNKWFSLYKIQFCLPNNIMLLVTLDKFDPNLVLVILNKLKHLFKKKYFLDEEA
jgi:hypothetical protein